MHNLFSSTEIIAILIKLFYFRFAFLFNNEILSDVHFVVGKGEGMQRIPAHKFVLAVGSAVFDAMFNGRLSTHQREIELPDVEAQAFLALLRFLYR